MSELDMFLYVLDGSDHVEYQICEEGFLYKGKKYDNCIKVVLTNWTGRIAIYFDKDGKRIY